MFKIYNRKIFAFLRPLPLVVIAWSLIRTSGFEFGLLTPLAVTILLLAVGALCFEFALSADISVKAFSRDLTFALFNLVLGTVLISWLIFESRGFGLADLLLFLVVLVDAWLGTTNSFRTALRNWTGNITKQG